MQPLDHAMNTICTSANDLALYLIQQARNRSSEGMPPMTNLRLNKSLYFMQGFSYVKFGLPCFGDDIEAWTYGPVVPEVYLPRKIYGSCILPDAAPPDYKAPAVSPQLVEPLQDLVRDFLDWSRNRTSGDLVNITHKHGSPWYNVWNMKFGSGKFRTIPPESIRDYFVTHYSVS